MNYKKSNKGGSMIKFATLDREKPMSAVLKVVGVGGGGCNALGSMIARGLQGVEYVAVNKIIILDITISYIFMRK